MSKLTVKSRKNPLSRSATPPEVFQLSLVITVEPHGSIRPRLRFLIDAKKVPGPTGDQWFVAPHALPKLIGDLQQWQMQRAGHSQTRPAVTEPVMPEKCLLAIPSG